MDKRILAVIAGTWLVAIGLFTYKKVYSASRPIKPFYTTSIKQNTTIVGAINTFSDQTEDATGWKWNFGDDEYSFEKSPEHSYNEPGQYPVTLTVYGSFGHVKDQTKTITVVAAMKKDSEAEILGASTVASGSSSTFSSSIVADSYDWQVVGEPGYQNSRWKGKDVMLSFRTPGEKTLSLTLSNPDLTISKTISVSAAPIPMSPKKPKPKLHPVPRRQDNEPEPKLPGKRAL